MGRNLSANRGSYSNALLTTIAESFWAKFRDLFSKKRDMPKVFCLLFFGWNRVKILKVKSMSTYFYLAKIH